MIVFWKYFLNARMPTFLKFQMPNPCWVWNIYKYLMIFTSCEQYRYNPFVEFMAQQRHTPVCVKNLSLCLVLCSYLKPVNYCLLLLFLMWSYCHKKSPKVSETEKHVAANGLFQKIAACHMKFVAKEGRLCMYWVSWLVPPELGLSVK